MNYIQITQQEYKDLVVRIISPGERLRATASFPPGDPKATIGFGYTFNRNNNVALWQAA